MSQSDKLESTARESKALAFLDAIFEASVFLDPYFPGLSLEEAKEALRLGGYDPGDSETALLRLKLETVTQGGNHLLPELKRRESWANFDIPKNPDQRSIVAFDFVHWEITKLPPLSYVPSVYSSIPRSQLVELAVSRNIPRLDVEAAITLWVVCGHLIEENHSIKLAQNKGADISPEQKVRVRDCPPCHRDDVRFQAQEITEVLIIQRRAGHGKPKLGPARITRRRVYHYAIVDREGRAPTPSPQDFHLSLRGSSDSPYLPERALPYCVDVARERMLFTCHTPEDCVAMFAAPFMYIEQWRRAGSVLAIPFERLVELALTPIETRPVFIFSPGRCATTLLAALLGSVGAACVSEPDIFTQLTCLPSEDQVALQQGTESLLAGICVATLARLLGPDVFVKLRSQSNARPLLLIESAPRSRAVFVLRRAAPWALSRHRAFNEPPGRLADILCEAMTAFDALDKSGVPLSLLWHDTISNDPAAALRICAPNLSPDMRSIAAVMAKDSQEGTVLARETIPPTEVGEAFFAEFADSWNRECANVQWGKRTGEVLARVFQ